MKDDEICEFVWWNFWFRIQVRLGWCAFHRHHFVYTFKKRLLLFRVTHLAECERNCVLVCTITMSSLYCLPASATPNTHIPENRTEPTGIIELERQRPQRQQEKSATHSFVKVFSPIGIRIQCHGFHGKWVLFCSLRIARGGVINIVLVYRSRPPREPLPNQ